MPIILMALTIAIFGVVLAVSVYQLVLQNGRILRRLEALECAGAKARAPDEAPDPCRPVQFCMISNCPLAGGSMTLSQWRGRAAPGDFLRSYMRLLPELLPNLSHAPTITTLIISTGDREKNRSLFSAHAFTSPSFSRKIWRSRSFTGLQTHRRAILSMSAASVRESCWWARKP